jgi:hypothetical protein
MGTLWPPGGGRTTRQPVSVVYQGSMSWWAIVVRSLPGDTPEDIERMIAEATNGDANANVLHIKRVAV